MTNPFEQRARIMNLLKLIQENPALPIIPMVDEEIVADDCMSRWMGSWGEARVDEYAEHNEHIYFRGDDDDYDLFCEFYDEDVLMGMTEDAQDKLIEEKVGEIPWTKAIVVDIDLPE